MIFNGETFTNHLIFLPAYSIIKVCPIENNTNLNSIFCLMKSSRINFIFLPAFYLIMWLMTPPNRFEKIAILKKWQMVFYWGVKNYFGAMPLKSCIFRHESFYLCQYFPSNNYCSHQMESVLYQDDTLIIFGDHNTSKTLLLLPWINISMTN